MRGITDCLRGLSIDATWFLLSNGVAETVFMSWSHKDNRAPSQYPKRRLSVRSRKVSKPRDLYLEWSDRSEIWQALRQRCCRCACQISNRYDNLKYKYRGFETLRDLTKRRPFGYWDGAQSLSPMRSALRPLTSLGTSAWPYRVTTQYSYYIAGKIYWQRTPHKTLLKQVDP